MKERTYYTLSCMLGIMISFPAQADVKFIIDSGEHANFINSGVSTEGSDQACIKQGFKIKASTCTGNKNPGLLCPNDPSYTNECCSLKYAYVVTSHCSHNTVPSSDTCGGRYKCICDPVEYPKGPDRDKCTGQFAYDEINYCAETYYDADGSEYETRYFKGCTCSSSYARCNSAYNLVGVGEGCSYKDNIYYRSCKCDTGYNKLCLASGALNSRDYCLFKGKRYYRVCNTNENDDKTDNEEMESTEQ